jgi:hypothetical protein
MRLVGLNAGSASTVGVEAGLVNAVYAAHGAPVPELLTTATAAQRWAPTRPKCTNCRVDLTLIISSG